MLACDRPLAVVGMRVDARTKLIWRVRGTLGPEGHLILVGRNVNPAEDATVRAELAEAVNARAAAARYPWADDRGLLRHGDWQLCDEPPEDVLGWQQVWDLVSPGITPERVAELRAAWVEGAGERARVGPHLDDRLHMAQCAFYDPAPEFQTVQLALFNVAGAR